MVMRKKVIYLLLLGLIISTALYIRHYKNQQDYDRKYHISINETSIEGNLQMWLNRYDGMNLDPGILDIQRLGTSSTYMVLYKLGNNKFGAAQLIKGRNNKLRIKQASSGDLLDNKVEDIKTNKGRYFLVMGKNPDLVIDHIEVKVDYKKSYSYLVNVSKDEFYYNYKKIPKELDQRTKIIYYDKNNREFTDDQLRVIF
jgi:hypothetical protein